MRDQFLWDDRTLEVIRASGQRRARSTELQIVIAELIARSRENIVHSRKLLARIPKSSTDSDE
ncbi:MAG TPA: hypothetical protein VIQ53_24440 [Inquilinus sp.]|uniref:hypothetical protein n=1 Tax=Inquilinus sp. TaxID=1932117 RepID=UPI002FA47301